MQRIDALSAIAPMITPDDLSTTSIGGTWEWKDRKPTDGIEAKYRFPRYVEKLEGVVIHPGAPRHRYRRP